MYYRHCRNRTVTGREIAEQSQQSDTTFTQTNTQTTPTSQDPFSILHISTASTINNTTTLTVYHRDFDSDSENEATELYHKHAHLTEEPINPQMNNIQDRTSTTTEHIPRQDLPPPPLDDNQGATRTADNLLKTVYGMTSDDTDGLDNNPEIQDDQV